MVNNTDHITAHCEDCGAKAREDCSPLCQQDESCKPDTFNVVWNTKGRKGNIWFQAKVLKEPELWCDIGYYKTLKEATDECEKHKGLKFRVIEEFERTWEGEG